MRALQSLAANLPEAAEDIRLDLPAVLQSATLTPAQVAAAVVEDAVGAASRMAMNSVYYRFRHLVGRAEYEQKPPRLRMQRLQKPATNAADFELMALAVSAVHGCAVCVQSHERVVTHGGLTQDHARDAVRIAAALHGAAVALTSPRTAVAG